MICAVCAHGEAFEVLSYEGYPAFLVPLPMELARNVELAPLTLVACLRCGHFQVPEVDPRVQRLLYEVYYTHYQVDTMETMVPAYRDPFNRLVQSLAADGLLPKGRLLEIGCSSGAMVPFLSAFCDEYTGVDPSERIELARAAHPSHTFVHAYFPSEEVRGPFDVAVTQFNLEHIEDAAGFVRSLAAIVREGGLVLAQVPDAGYYLRTAQPNFVAHEHVQYFRRAQLEMLLARHGFAVERWGEEGASILCAARRVAGNVDPVAIADPLADAKTLRALALDTPVLPPRPVLYGVGLTLYWLLANDPELALEATVVDDNTGYHGKGVSGYDLPIAKPSPELLEGRDVVLALNAIYHDRVLERLRAMQVPMRVHRITETGWTAEKL
ncbi:MAG TPA: class I SAM-dependent methyltransferase [Thermoanaerobaculia bacterium]|jgi:2-polyprenyl-3-methyl-5-hydroxy-6-metoxy-1,4-benzoquinol methylase|nr:class I SAM-dependent methyltransferase [Thermoanaerobaculia bacterium]